MFAQYFKAFCFGLISFFSVIGIWSFLVGDWHHQQQNPDDIAAATLKSTASDEFAFQHSFEKSPTRDHWSTWPGYNNIKHIFFFGDSYSDTWFDTTGQQPSAQVPFGNAARVFHGPEAPPPKWTTFLVQNRQAQGELLAYNLAVSGAPVNGTGPAWSIDDVEDLVTQVRRRFIPRYGASPPEAPWKSDDTLFVMFGGTNDLVPFFGAGMRPNIQNTVSIYAQLMDELYNHGARHFLLLNIPPFEMTQPTSSILPQIIRTADIAEYNAQLKTARNAFMRRHRDATAHFFDLRSLWLTLMANPQSSVPTANLAITDQWCWHYSVANTTLPDFFIPLCGEPLGRYFWVDDVHAGVPAHQATALYIALDCFSQPVPQGFCS